MVITLQPTFGVSVPYYPKWTKSPFKLPQVIFLLCHLTNSQHKLEVSVQVYMDYVPFKIKGMSNIRRVLSVLFWSSCPWPIQTGSTTLFWVTTFKWTNSGNQRATENKITTTASRMRERMIHQIFMLVISSQHLETEGRRERFMRTSQKYLTATAQSVVLWQSFAVPFPLVNSRAPALWWGHADLHVVFIPVFSHHPGHEEQQRHSWEEMRAV